MKQTRNYFAVLSLDDDMPSEDAELSEHDNFKLTKGGKDPSEDHQKAETTNKSTLVEKVPPEVHLEIFKHVLRTEYSVVNVGHLPAWKRGYR